MNKADNRGFTLGELVIVFVIVLIIVVALLPFVKYISIRSDRIMCSNNLRELGRASYIYARENNTKFPDSLKVLYDEQYLADKRFVDCPATGKIGTPEDPDYIYTAGLTVKSSSLEPIIRDKAKNHSKGMNILYVNGAVVWEEQ